MSQQHEKLFFIVHAFRWPTSLQSAVRLTVFQLRTDPSQDSIPQPSNHLITALLRTLKTASNCKYLDIYIYLYI